MKKLFVCSMILVISLLVSGCDLFNQSGTVMKVVNDSSETIAQLEVLTYAGVESRIAPPDPDPDPDPDLNDALDGQQLAPNASVNIELPPNRAEGVPMKVTVKIGTTNYSVNILYDPEADFTLTFKGTTANPKFTVSGDGAQEQPPI